MSTPSICKSCNGTGEKSEDVGGHQSEYKYYMCPKCNGTGKVLIYTYQFQVPFDTDTKITNEIDSKIFDLIRNIEK